MTQTYTKGSSTDTWTFSGNMSVGGTMGSTGVSTQSAGLILNGTPTTTISIVPTATTTAISLGLTGKTYATGIALGVTGGTLTAGITTGGTVTTGISLAAASTTGINVSGAVTTGMNVQGSAMTTGISIGLTGKTYTTGIFASVTGSTITTGISFVGTSTTGIDMSGAITTGANIAGSAMTTGISIGLTGKTYTTGIFASVTGSTITTGISFVGTSTTGVDMSGAITTGLNIAGSAMTTGVSIGLTGKTYTTGIACGVTGSTLTTGLEFTGTFVTAATFGTTGTPLSCAAYTDSALKVYTTNASVDAGNSVEPVLFNTVMTGAGGVGGRVRVNMETDVALGGWANAFKASVDCLTSGRATGLMSVSCHEMTMPASAGGAGTYAIIEAEIVCPASWAGTNDVNVFYIAASGATVTNFDTYGYLFDLSGVASGAGSIWYDNQKAAPAVEEFIRVKTPSGIRYLALYDANA